MGAQRPVVLITGGSRGIGAATARLVAERGFRVCLTYRTRRDAADALVAEIERAGGEATALAADVSHEPDVTRLFSQIDSRVGRLTALVNNAGVVDRQLRLDEMSAARLQRVFGINAIGAFLCAREAVRRMSTRHAGSGGVIVNVSSAASRLGSPGEYIDYAASKGAIDTLTIGLAKEVGREGIRVAAVRPGLIETEIHASGGDPGRVDRLSDTVPVGRGGRPLEVARAIVWLLSEEASYTSGAILDVAGGR